MHYSIVRLWTGASGLHFNRHRFECLADPLPSLRNFAPDLVLVVMNYHRHPEYRGGQQDREEGFLCLTLSDLLACLGVEPGGSTFVIEYKPEYQAF